MRGVVEARLNTTETTARDPRFDAEYRSACQVDVDEHGLFVRRFTVHVPDSASQPYARRAGRFLALMWGAANRRFGTLSSGLRKTPVDVWLSRTGEAGGEQYRANLYIYDFVSERSGIEWAREIAHEYGHYLLPGASGYTSPENWSNGLLGERLFLRWLLDDLVAGRIPAEEVPFVKPADLVDYCAKQVTPLIDRMKNSGPDSAALARLDRKGMDAFTSLLLYADEVYGPASILNMLDNLPVTGAAGARGPEFLTAFTLYASRLDIAALNLERNRPVMIYIPAGTVRIDGVGTDKLTISGAPRTSLTAVSGGWTLRSTMASWRALTVSGAAGSALITWKRIAQ